MAAKQARREAERRRVAEDARLARERAAAEKRRVEEEARRARERAAAEVARRKQQLIDEALPWAERYPCASQCVKALLFLLLLPFTLLCLPCYPCGPLRIATNTLGIMNGDGEELDPAEDLYGTAAVHSVSVSVNNVLLPSLF